MFFYTLCLIYEPSRKNSFQTKIIPLHHLESPEGHLHQKLFYTLKKQTAKKENSTHKPTGAQEDGRDESKSWMNF